MRQLVYTSISTALRGKADLESILEQSRHNNALDGVTGLLWTDGYRFLQVLEGSPESIDVTFARIRSDMRHTDITVEHDTHVDDRQFGGWSMVTRLHGDAGDARDVRMRRIIVTNAREASLPYLNMVPD